MSDNEGSAAGNEDANPVQNNPNNFALTPALALTGTIDYSTKQGIQLYKDATEKLSSEKFDCQAVNLKVFLESLKNRASAYGWSSILDIPKDVNQPLSNLTNLLEQYGELELKDIRAFVRTYIGTPTRAAQDEAQLYACLCASLTQDALSKVTTWKKDYTINEPGIDHMTSGTLMLKVILRETHTDTRGTILHLREQLSKLDNYIPTINYDITKFNEHVMDLIKGLNSRGAHTEDLLANLFKAYQAVADAQFVEYIRKKKDAYDEGEDIEPETLMHNASMKYTNMVRDKTWQAPSAAEEKILALEAKLQSLQKTKSRNNNRTNQNNRRKQSSRNNSGGTRNNRRKNPEWMTKRPKREDIDKPKKVDGREYWWCPNHKRFTRHKPSECRGVNVNRRQSSGNNHNANQSDHQESQQQENSPQLRLSEALTSVVEEE